MILMNDFKRESEALVKVQVAAAERVIRSGWYVLGGEVSSFEKEWAEWLGIPYAIGVGNGLDALEIGLRALGIGSGDEVVTTPMTAFATILSILRVGAEPVLADIDPSTAIIDPESVARCISGRTKAVMIVHLYGQAGPVERLSEICASRNIHLIEDCAQAHGAKASGRPAGMWGICAGWSFYPTKNLGCIGDGGAITTTSVELAEHAKRIRNYGQSVRYRHPEVGLNSRLDELQAAILRVRLIHLDEWTESRRRIAASYAEGISNRRINVLPMPDDPQRHVHHLFVVTAKNRQGLHEHMKASGVETFFHYPVPAHHQEPCLSLRRDPKGLGHAERHAEECLSLPIHPNLNADEVERVIAAANSWDG